MYTTNPPSLQVILEAKRLHDAGLWLTPVKTDGTKAPMLKAWNTERRCWTDLRPYWNGQRPFGIGIVLGDGHYAFDFDGYDAFDECSDIDYVTMDTVLIRTPSGGYHCHFKCSELQIPSQVLAYKADGIHPAIEYKGGGSKVIAPGSPLTVHPSGLPYRLEHGDLDAIPEISADGVRELIAKCKTLDKRQGKQVTPGEDRRMKVNSSADRPGDCFNREGKWDDILLPLGWKAVHRSVIEQSDLEHKGWRYYRRPGATTRGHDAAVNEKDLLRVFSGSCSPLQPETTYTKFTVFTLLYHQGDFRAAASELKRRGFGGTAALPDLSDGLSNL